MTEWAGTGSTDVRPRKELEPAAFLVENPDEPWHDNLYFNSQDMTYQKRRGRGFSWVREQDHLNLEKLFAASDIIQRIQEKIDQRKEWSNQADQARNVGETIAHAEVADELEELKFEISSQEVEEE